jgi:glycosyltransferase involved in cell wall biosynthesis
MRPRVSIVMPSYNRADLIVESIRSVIAQTFSEWELIVVDDGSTDDSNARIEALAEPRIAVVCQPRIGNVARLRNIGAGAAHGDYLAFLDSDDLWLPAKLELQLAGLAGKPDAWSYASHALADAQGVQMPLRSGRFAPVSGKILHALLTEETSAAVITWLVPRAVFERLGGFDEQLRLREDLDLALRLAQAADAVAMPQVLALTRDHPGRKTRAAADQHRLTAIVFERAAKRIDDPLLRRLARRRRADHLASAASGLIAQGRLIAGGAQLGQALGSGVGLRGAARSAAAGLWQLLGRR